MPDNNARARQGLYERARAIVLEELRKQDPAKLAPEQAQLEAAIRRLEAESSAKPGADVRAAAQRKSARGYLARIFWSPRPAKPPPERKPPTPAPARPQQVAASDRPAPNTTDELGGMLNSLRTMLFGTAFLVAVLAITGVVYVRGLIWVAAGVISYPALLAVTAIVFSLLIIVPRAMFHNASAVSAFGFVSRLIYSASRRVL